MNNYSMIAEKANLKKIEDAIREDRVDSKNKWDETPLMFAVAEGYPDKVRKLINMGADVNAKSCLLDSVIMYLSKVKNKAINKEILKILLDNGARLNCRNSDGDTILIKAIKENNTSMVENLIDLDIDVEQTGSELLTPLMTAAKNGYTKILNLLIQSGADIARRDINFNTALIYAIAYNQTKAVDFLIAEGAKVESYFIFNILKLIDKNYLDSKGLVKYLDYLISKGADIDYHGYYGKENEEYTPLMIALTADMDYELIEALIKAGAKVNMSKNCLNNMGELKLKSGYRYQKYMTPLKLAIEQNRDQIADYLIEQGARYNMLDKDIWAYREEDYLSNSREEDEGKSLKEDYDLEEFFEAFADKSSEE